MENLLFMILIVSLRNFQILKFKNYPISIYDGLESKIGSILRIFSEDFH